MAKINVHLLNFHGIHSHIEVLLECTIDNSTSFYTINNWETPSRHWWPERNCGYILKDRIEKASSVFSFEIDEDPQSIRKDWNAYYKHTDRSIFSHNCADATQWFLSQYAAIPNPNLSNISWNYGLLYLWPSFIPSLISLPGRIMSNAKFYVQTRENAKAIEMYSKLSLYTSLSLATMAFSASIFALTMATTLLTGGLAALAITGCVAVGATSLGVFSKNYNQLSAKKIVDADLARQSAVREDPVKENPVREDFTLGGFHFHTE